MAYLHSASLLLVLGTYLLFGVAQDICNTHHWDLQALHNYCTLAGRATYRSPACTIYRLCDSAPAALPSLVPALCNSERLFLTLCTDQPELSECVRFRRRLAVVPAHEGCIKPTALKLWSTQAVQKFLATRCSHGLGNTITSASTIAATECDLCTSPELCDASDPLLTYTTLCLEDSTAAGCEPWAEFCAHDPQAAAPALCVHPGGSALRTAVGLQSYPPPPPADPCILNSTDPSCKSYKYPDSAALANINTLCNSMPDMPGCAIARACASDRRRVSDKYCRPFVLLATLCHDMPGMRGCDSYKQLCKMGSVVEQCVVEGPVPRAPTTSQARKAVFGACADHPMSGCANCTSMDCPDPLASLAAICHEMPDMAACAGFWAFCEAAGQQDVAEWCSEDDDKYLPAMLMYFHQRTQELLLWKEWRPRTKGQYVGSVLAIVAMGVVATGLKTAKGALTLQWNHQRALRGVEPKVISVWVPRSGQGTEILAKAAITGISLTLDYFNMLIAMTFNVGFFCAVIAGYIIGTLLFSHVLENYAAILHQRRRDADAALKRRAPSQGRVAMANGNGSNGAGVALQANGNVVVAPLAGSAAAGAVVALGSHVTSDEDEGEEKLLLVLEGEGECNCVHSA